MITIELLKKLQKILRIDAVCREAKLKPANIQQKMYRNSELNVREAAAIEKVLKEFFKLIEEN